MQRSDLTLEVHDSADRRLVEVAGEIDIATNDALDRCERECTIGFAGAINVYLRGVRFMDTTGVWMLAGMAAEAETAAWSFAVVPSAAARRVLALTDTLERIPILEPAAAG